jgi:hypothetical protein
LSDADARADDAGPGDDPTTLYPRSQLSAKSHSASADGDAAAHACSRDERAGYAGADDVPGAVDTHRRADRNTASSGHADPDAGRQFAEPRPRGARIVRIRRDDRVRRVDLAPLPQLITRNIRVSRVS